MYRRLGELSRSRIAEAEPGDCEESAAGAVRLSQLLPASRRALVLQSLENLWKSTEYMGHIRTFTIPVAELNCH